MATNSIYKQVHIRDKQQTRKFVLALENAQYKSSTQVVQSRKVREIKNDDEIRALFKVN